MKETHSISTPRGVIISTAGASGNTTARLEWNPGFGPAMSGKLNKTQAFVDSEVLRRTAPYVPLRTGQLMMSGTLGTEIGSGVVQYVAPYARAQYYSTRSPGSMTGKLRGPKFFERMKNAHGKEILDAAARIAGGEASK